MSVAEMKRLITERLEKINDASRLERIVDIIEEEPTSRTDMKGFFDDAVSRYGDVLQKLAE